MNAQYLIYALVDPRTLLVRYVGASRSGLARPRHHRWPSSMARNRHSSCWVRSLHAQGLTYDITILEQGFETERALYDAEQWWILYGRALGWDLTNLTDGGEGPVGWIPTPETRIRIAKALTGRKASPETRAKMSVARKGKPLPESAKLKLSAQRKGVPRSAAARAKMSEAAKKRPPRPQGAAERLRRSMPKVAPFMRINLLPKD